MSDDDRTRMLVMCAALLALLLGMVLSGLSLPQCCMCGAAMGIVIGQLYRTAKPG